MRRKTFWQNRHYLSLASLSVNTCLLSQWDQSVYEVLLKFLCTFIFTKPGQNVSTTPITAMECRQCFYVSVVPLKGKLIWKLLCLNGVVDTFRPFGLAHKKIQSCRASGTYENRYLPFLRFLHVFCLCHNFWTSTPHFEGWRRVHFRIIHSPKFIPDCLISIF